MQKRGVLSDRIIKEMIQKGQILDAMEGNVNPGSLDLSISEEIYRVEGIFQPRPGENISNLLNSIEIFPHSLDYPLERNVIYLARVQEKLLLPRNVGGYCNPKSSTGRNDVHVRILANGLPRYDTIPDGYQGDLWVTIHPRSFPIKILAGETLSQIRFFSRRNMALDESELCSIFDQDNLIRRGNKILKHSDIEVSDKDGSVILTLDLTDEIIGYQCFGCNRVLDYSKLDHYKPEDFFEPISLRRNLRNNYIRLKSGGFYILSTRELLRVPPTLACEMSPVDERNGEFRSHYAGFIDPGWGWSNRNKKGRPLTLELRPFEDLIVRENQPIAKIRFERMIEEPERTYDKKTTSHYLNQFQPKLSKHFQRQE